MRRFSPAFSHSLPPLLKSGTSAGGSAAECPNAEATLPAMDDPLQTMAQSDNLDHALLV
jgi:hypothetical protein